MTAPHDHDYWLCTEADDVDSEIIDIARDITDDTPPGERIDWDDVWDRMDSTELRDGSLLDLGNLTDSPARWKIKRIIRAERAND